MPLFEKHLVLLESFSEDSQKHFRGMKTEMKTNPDQRRKQEHYLLHILKTTKWTNYDIISVSIL